MHLALFFAFTLGEWNLEAYSDLPQTPVGMRRKRFLSGQEKSHWSHNCLRCETVGSEMDPKASSPQKHAVKGRSKSTEEIQQAKKAFHTTQKSLPSTGEESNVQDSGEATDENSPKGRTSEGQTQN